jgi:hypothetical protein
MLDKEHIDHEFKEIQVCVHSVNKSMLRKATLLELGVPLITVAKKESNICNQNLL